MRLDTSLLDTRRQIKLAERRGKLRILILVASYLTGGWLGGLLGTNTWTRHYFSETTSWGLATIFLWLAVLILWKKQCNARQKLVS